MNFEYWRDRCEFERDEETVSARKSIHLADQAFEAARLEEAGRLYEEGIQRWRKVLDKYPKFRVDSNLLESLYDMIDRYANFLNKDDKAFPDDFLLKDVMINWQKINRASAPKKWVPTLKLDDTAPAGETPADKPKEEPGAPATVSGDSDQPANPAPAKDAAPANEKAPAEK